MTADQTEQLAFAGAPQISGSARRQRVIDGAAATFARHGYHGVGTRAIAEALGMKAASLYCHIGSKEEALEEVCRQGIALPLAYLEEAIATRSSMAGRLRRFFDLQAEFIQHHRDYLAVFMQERRHLPPEAGQRISAIARQLRVTLDGMYQQARERGELHPSLSPRSASLITIGAIRNTNQFARESTSPGQDAFVRDAVEALIRAVAAPGADAGEENGADTDHDTGAGAGSGAGTGTGGAPAN